MDALSAVHPARRVVFMKGAQVGATESGNNWLGYIMHHVPAPALAVDGLRSGRAPVLNTHRRRDARDVLGRGTAARLEAGRGYATLQFSAATDVEPVWERIDADLGGDQARDTRRPG